MIWSSLNYATGECIRPHHKYQVLCCTGACCLGVYTQRLLGGLWLRRAGMWGEGTFAGCGLSGAPPARCCCVGIAFDVAIVFYFPCLEVGVGLQGKGEACAVRNRLAGLWGFLCVPGFLSVFEEPQKPFASKHPAGLAQMYSASLRFLCVWMACGKKKPTGKLNPPKAASLARPELRPRPNRPAYLGDRGWVAQCRNRAAFFFVAHGSDSSGQNLG